MCGGTAMFPFLLLFALLLISTLVWRRRRHLARWDHFPGPKGSQSLPFVGHSYMLASEGPITKMLSMRRQYGDVFRLDLGPTPTVVVADYDLAVEIHRHEAFLGRPFQPGVAGTRLIDPEGNTSGLAFTHGKLWRDNKQIMSSSLHGLGMAKGGAMEGIVMQEVDSFCDILRSRLVSSASESILINGMFLRAANNILWRLSTGKSTKQTDPRLTEIIEAMVKFQTSFNPASLHYMMTNNNSTLLALARFLGLRNIVDNVKPLMKWIEEEISEGVPNKDGYVIDRFMAEIDKNEKEGRSSATFYGERGQKHLFGSIMDLFIAGTDTSSTFMEWAVYFMISNPDVQERVYLEIRDKIGARAPELSDRANTPYVEAVIEEVMRFSPMTNFVLPHSNDRDVTIDGYFFPKETQLVVLHSGILLNPENFPDPLNFFPERFLDLNGEFSPNEKSMFFGVGRRRCIGEVLGKAEAYLFFTTVFQNFKLRSKPGFKRKFEPVGGIIFYPEQFQAFIQLRE